MDTEDNKQDILKQLEILRQQKLKQSIPQEILNRRFKKLQELIESEDRFSEESIRIRDPLLYFLYCGYYERIGQEFKGNFNNFLMDTMMNQEYEKRLD